MGNVGVGDDGVGLLLAVTEEVDKTKCVLTPKSALSASTASGLRELSKGCSRFVNGASLVIEGEGGDTVEDPFRVVDDDGPSWGVIKKMCVS